MKKRLLIYFALYIFSICSLNSQGIYKEFGQNRVQYRIFDWKQFSLNNIDLLYYDNEDLLAGNALEIANGELSRLENLLSYKYGGAMQILLFSNLNDYRQSNIGYTNPQLNSGGYLVIPNDVNAIYFNGSYADLKIQLRKAICDIIIREMIYGGTLQDRFERVRSPMLPIWFTGGLTEFLAESWNAETENLLINAFASHGFSNFNNLSTSETLLAGQSFWRYLVEVYGVESVSTIVFISRYTHSAEAAIYFHTHKNIVEILKEWREFYQNALAVNVLQNIPGGTSNIPAKISGKNHTDFALSPDGKSVAIVTNDQGRFDIWDFTLNNGDINHIYNGGQKVLNQLPDFDFPRIKWNPKKNTLNFITYENGRYRLLEYKKGGITEISLLSDVTNIVDFSYSPTGDSIIICGVKDGRSDLYQVHLSSGKITQLTSDLYEDLNAIYTETGNILFVSNRPIIGNKNTDFTTSIHNIFELKNGNIKAISQFKNPINIHSLISYSAETTGFLSNESGLVNAYAVNNETAKIIGQTNYRSGILSQCISANKSTLGELLLLNGQYHIFTSQVSENPMVDGVLVSKCRWKNTISNLDSLFAERNIRLTETIINGNDSVTTAIIDSTNRDYEYQTGFIKVDFNKKDNDTIVRNTSFKRVSFFNSLQPDYLLSQSENRVLGSYYQSNLMKRESLRNPLIMPYIKVSLSDMLKNYILETGARSSLDLLITDYTARFGFYKYRIDHDISVSRHNRKYEDGSGILKQHISTQVQYTLSYPFNENSRITFSTGGRHEYNTVKASESQTLNIPDITQNFIAGKTEYLYDNTVSLGLNMVSGLRISTGVDYYKMLKSRGSISNFFADLRYYLPVYRKIIWASRLTGAYSFGNTKVAYFLGAVENWTQKNQFVSNLPQLSMPEFVFQHWVSNLRGFSRGIRMGSNYFLLNSEIRLPIFQTFVAKPMESEFFRNFTITGFADMGTAFNGKTPSDPTNPFNTVYLTTPNYDLSITSSRNPYVFGTGFGVRTRFLGYFIKFDRGYGFSEHLWQKPINYFSIGFDF